MVLRSHRNSRAASSGLMTSCTAPSSELNRGYARRSHAAGSRRGLTASRPPRPTRWCRLERVEGVPRSSPSLQDLHQPPEVLVLVGVLPPVREPADYLQIARAI